MSVRSMTRDEVRDVDRRAIEDFGVPGMVLMENAGRGIATLLIERGIRGPVVICAGRGNNAGDGFVIARHLENRGDDVRVLLFSDPDELKGDAAANYQIIERAGTPMRIIASPVDVAELDRELERADWIIDALLGTGVQGDVREPFATVIRRINAAPARVLAVDIPSGLDCDTGQPLGECVRADDTATMVACKRGFDAPGADKWTGAVHIIDIGVPRILLNGRPSASPDEG